MAVASVSRPQDIALDVLEQSSKAPVLYLPSSKSFELVPREVARKSRLQQIITMTSVARTLQQGTFISPPAASDVGRLRSGCSAVLTPVLRCKGPGAVQRGRRSTVVQTLKGADTGLVKQHAAYLGGGSLWRRATADCRCASSRVQMSEPSLYKG